MRTSTMHRNEVPLNSNEFVLAFNYYFIIQNPLKLAYKAHIGVFDRFRKICMNFFFEIRSIFFSAWKLVITKINEWIDFEFYLHSFSLAFSYQAVSNCERFQFWFYSAFNSDGFFSVFILFVCYLQPYIKVK